MAGPDITEDRDAYAYLVESDGDLALIDTGAGPSYPRIIENMTEAGFAPESVRLIIATHCHIDHIGGLEQFVRDYSPTIIAHSRDAEAIETADPLMTAANWYGLHLRPVHVDRQLEGSLNTVALGKSELKCLHTPGHTPGSMVAVLDRDGRRYLFGQDIHGPFDPSFKSDISQWRESMYGLLDLKADVLAEGHYGIIRGKPEVAAFIQGFLDRFH